VSSAASRLSLRPPGSYLTTVSSNHGAATKVLFLDSLPQTLQPIDNGTIYVTIETMVDIREYNDRGSRSPFREWYDGLNSDAARKVTTALYRVGLGNFSNAKSVGAGVYECKINFGPGYRVYFGKEGEQTVILLGGGTKQRQQNDIKLALERWEDYKQRKKQQKEKKEE
jgi:putative addiction module killer protein